MQLLPKKWENRNFGNIEKNWSGRTGAKAGTWNDVFKEVGIHAIFMLTIPVYILMNGAGLFLSRSQNCSSNI